VPDIVVRCSTTLFAAPSFCPRSRDVGLNLTTDNPEYGEQA
jgi:hypothetical protein